MIQKQSVLNVIDNSGAKKVRCFHVKRGSIASIGDIIMVSVREAIPRGKVKVGEKYKAIVVQTVSQFNRKNGDSIKFSMNSVVLIDDKFEPIGTRVVGTIPRELPQKIKSLSSGVC